MDSAGSEEVAAARACSRQGDWPRAAELWRACAAAAPEAPEPPLRLAEALGFLGRHDEALPIASRAASLAPEDGRPLLLVARALHALEAPDTAEAWRAVLKRTPGSFEAWARLAEALRMAGEVDGGLAAVLSALALQPEHPFAVSEAAALLALVPEAELTQRLTPLMAAASRDAVLALLMIAAEHAPANARLQAGLAQRLMQRRATAEALAPLQRLAATEPANFGHATALARVLHQLGRWPEAIAAWRRLHKLQPAALEPALLLAQAQRRNGQPAPAATLLRKLLKRFPTSAPLLTEWEANAMARGRAAEADAAWAAALAAEPEDQALRQASAARPAEPARAAARSAAEAADWPAAATAWAAVLKLRPEDAEAQLGLGTAEMARGRAVEALPALAAALRLTPGVVPLRLLVRAHLARGEEREAALLWEELLADAPTNPEALQGLAEARARAGDLAGALSAAETACAAEGATPEARRLLARLRERAELPRGALALWEGLAEEEPRDQEAQAQAGALAARLGLVPQAEARLRLSLGGSRQQVRAAAALVTLLTAQHRLPEARRLLRRWLRLMPAHPLLWRAAFGWLRTAGRGAVTERYCRALGRRAATPDQKLALADRLLEAGRPLAARAALAGLGAPALGRLNRIALETAAPETAPSPPAPELVPALRYSARLREQTGIANDVAAYAARLARAAARRGHPRYLPLAGSLVILAEAVAPLLPQALAWAGPVTLLRTSLGAPVPEAAALAGIGCAEPEDFAAERAACLAALPELTVPSGPYGEALRPRALPGLAAALRALRPACLVAQGDAPALAAAGLAALVLGVPRVGLMPLGAPPQAEPAEEAEAMAVAQQRVQLRAALLRRDARLFGQDAESLRPWASWLDLPARAVMPLPADGTLPWAFSAEASA